MEILRSKIQSTALLIAVGFLSTLLLTTFGSTQKAYAATGTMYLSPSTNTVLNGNQFTVQVRANATSANAAQIDLTYPSASLDLLTYSSSGSAMSSLAQAPVTSAGNFSVVVFAGGGAPSLNSDSLLMSFTFKAKVGSGNGTIALAPTSKLVDAGSQVSTSYGNSVVTFTSPTPPPPSAPVISSFIPSANSVISGGTVNFSWVVSNSVGCTITPGGPVNTTATNWTTPKLTVVGISGSTFTLTCKNSNGVVSVPKTVSITVSAIPIVTPTPTPVVTKVPTATPTQNTGSSSLSKTTPTPTPTQAGIGNTATPTPTVASTPKPSVTPTPEVKGAYTPPVALTPTIDTKKVDLVESTTIIIKGKDGKPLANVEVSFDGTNSKIFKTDKDGKVVITNVPAGKLSMKVTSNGKEIAKQDVTLVAGVTDTAQQVKLSSVNSKKSNTGLILSGVGVLLALLLAAAGLVIVAKKRNAAKPITLNTPTTTVNPTQPTTPTISKEALDAASADSAKVIVNDQNAQVTPTSVVEPPQDDPPTEQK